MKKVYTAENPAEAHLVAGLLEEEGIQCAVEGDLLTGARMALAMDSATLPTVLVRDEDAARAIQLIAERHAPRVATEGVRETAGEDDIDERSAGDSAGMVFFKRLLLTLVVLTVVGLVCTVLAFVLESAGMDVRLRNEVWFAILGIVLAASFGIAWLIVPGSRTRR